MHDDGDEDHKLVMVPVEAVDPAWSAVVTLDDVEPAELQRIQAFFRVYKELPEPGGRVELGPWEGPEVARAIIRAGLAGD